MMRAHLVALKICERNEKFFCLREHFCFQQNAEKCEKSLRMSLKPSEPDSN